MATIRVARIFDGERLHRDGGVVVTDGGQITDVRLGHHPDTVELIDGTLLPGLIDCHVHLGAGPGGLQQPPDDVRATIAASIGAHLRAGVTTVRDLGDLRGAVLGARRPGVVASGAPLTTPGGHCWFLGGEVRGPDAVRRAVRERVRQGAGVIKVMAGGGVLTPGTDPAGVQFTGEELTAAVVEAHAHGLPVTAHAHAGAAVRHALRAGVDGIEHATFAGDELAGELARAGTAVCPTLGSDPGVVVPPDVLATAGRAGLTQAGLQQGVARLWRAGVRIVAGSDAGIGPAKPHGILPRTLEEYVLSGMPAAAALGAATVAAAQACGVPDRKGRIRAGFDADLLIVAGDPVADITVLRTPIAVHAGGRE